jgi:hypothetical protein
MFGLPSMENITANISYSPGRFYASAFIKVVVAQLLLNYNFALVEPEASRWISWRVARIPKPWTKLTFTPRNVQD